MTIALLLSGGTALAQDTPTSRGYDETLGVIGQIDTTDTPAPKAETAPVQDDEVAAAEPTPAQPVQEEAGNLPFTGLDIGIVAMMGVLLLGTGFVRRRASSRQPGA